MLIFNSLLVMNYNEQFIPIFPLKNSINSRIFYPQKEESKEISYDAKQSKQKPLKELIPTLFQDGTQYFQNSHLINYFEGSKAFMTYFETPFTIPPDKMICPYYDFSSLVGKLTKIKNFRSDPKIGQTIIDLYESESGIKYVLKTFWLFFDPAKRNFEYLQSVKKFLAEKYNEYAILKIFSVCPHSAKPIDFILTYIPHPQNILVSELLQTYGGNPISECLPIQDAQLLYSILLQNTNALKYLEILRIAHNDIKSDNILVDYILDQLIIRYIDFDIGKIQSDTAKTTKQIGISGYSSCFAAPEIIRFANDPQQLKNIIYSPWKCQIYSMGILMLQLIGFFPTLKMNIKEIDQFKLSEIQYNTFINILSNFIENIFNQQLLKNILTIVKICLSYNSDARLSAKELSEILTGLDSKEKDSNLILREYDQILQKRGSVNLNNDLSIICENSILNNVRNVYFSQISNLTAKNENLSIEIKNIQNEFKNQINQYSSLEKEKKELNQHCIQLQKEVETLKKTIVKLESENKSPRHVLNAKQLETSKLIEELNKKINDLEENKKILQEANNDYIKNLDESLQSKSNSQINSEEFNEMKNKNAILKLQIHDFKEFEEEYKAKVQHYESENQQLKKYKDFYNENNKKFENFKEKILNEKQISIVNVTNYADLSENLYQIATQKGGKYSNVYGIYKK